MSFFIKLTHFKNMSVWTPTYIISSLMPFIVFSSLKSLIDALGVKKRLSYYFFCGEREEKSVWNSILSWSGMTAKGISVINDHSNISSVAEQVWKGLVNLKYKILCSIWREWNIFSLLNLQPDLNIVPTSQTLSLCHGILFVSFQTMEHASVRITIWRNTVNCSCV